MKTILLIGKVEDCMGKHYNILCIVRSRHRFHTVCLFSCLVFQLQNKRRYIAINCYLV